MSNRRTSFNLDGNELTQTMYALETFGGSRQTVRDLENKLEQNYSLYPQEMQTIVSALQQRAASMANMADTTSAVATGSALDKITAAYNDATHAKSSPSLIDSLIKASASASASDDAATPN